MIFKYTKTIIIALLTLLMQPWSFPQHSASLPGSRDFLCRIFDMDVIPLIGSGIDGALRNPANYNTGLEITKSYFSRSIENFIGASDLFNERRSHDAFNGGFSFNFSSDSWPSVSAAKTARGIKIVFGGQQNIQNLGEKEYEFTDWIYGIGTGYSFTKDLYFNLGFVKTLGHRYWDTDPVIIKSHLGADLNYRDHVIVNLTYRKVTHYDVYQIESPATLFSSYLFQMKWDYNTNLIINYGLFGKAYSNPSDISGYDPFLFIRLVPFYDASFPPNLVNFDIILGTRGRFSVGLDFAGFNFIYGKNNEGNNWKVVYFFALLLTGK